MYNKTQLNPDKEFERHVFHRDQFAHYLRWSHVLKIAKINMNILDVGCGTGNLLEVLYRNRYKAQNYLGLDIRKQTIDKANEKWKNIDWAEFNTLDLCKPYNVGNNWDIITSFEVIEHIGKENADNFLQNIKNAMNKNTILLLSTPNYDEKVGAAKNHIINGEVCEFNRHELYSLLNKYFKVEKMYGTFASQKDYKHLLNENPKLNLLWMYNRLSEYYDTNVLSVIMGLFFPCESRNILWRCKLK